MKHSDKIITLYVNTADPDSFHSIGEALASLEPWDAAPKAFPAPHENITPVTIYIGPGTYREKLVIDRPYVTLEGAGREKTVLVYGDYAREIMADGTKRGTFRTASLRVDTHDFTARHLTIQNDAGYGSVAGQALALYADGDRIYLEDCALLGSQDTLFTAPLPPKEAQPGGFTGPGEHKPRIMGRQYYKDCFLQGDVDFIFGSATAYFCNCIIFTKKRDTKPQECPEILGYVTAASTPLGEAFGYVFQSCHLTSDCPPHSVYLGRPWREYAKTVFLNCELGEHIHPLGWHDWSKPHGHFLYGEYCSYGPGASPDTRADFSCQLTDEEASFYTVERILGGWDPTPAHTFPE